MLYANRTMLSRNYRRFYFRKEVDFCALTFATGLGMIPIEKFDPVSKVSCFSEVSNCFRKRRDELKINKLVTFFLILGTNSKNLVALVRPLLNILSFIFCKFGHLKEF